MQSAKPLSIVFSGSVAANTSYIQQIHQKLSSTQSRVDVVCVDRNAIDPDQRSSLVGEIHVRTANTITDALEMAYFETVVIFQGQPALDVVLLKGLIEKLNANTFICSYAHQKLSRGYKHGLMWVNRLLGNVLLKSDVGQFDDGMLIFQRSHQTVDAISEVAKPLRAFLEDESMPTFGQLVSGLKMAGKYHVITTTDDFAIDTESVRKPNSKTILRATSKTVQTWWNTIMFPQPAPLGAQRSTPKQRVLKIGAWALLCLIAGLMLNQNLKYPFFEPDEARNAQIALNILDSGDWMSLELKNEHYWDKPPLVAWMTAISFQTFGVTENAARFPGVVMTFLLVILTCAIGQRLVGFRAAWVASLLTLLCLGVPFAGRYLTMDSTLALFATVTYLSIYRASFYAKFRQAWWVLAGVCVGFGLITKGPVILVLCAPPVILYSWLSGKRIFTTPKQLLYFAAPAVLIGGPWFVATAIGTPEFLTYFFWKHHVVRFTEGITHQQPFWYYLPVILLLMFPASQLFLPLAKFVGTRKPAVRQQRTLPHGYLFLYAFWVIAFFSISSAKLPTYILPAVPILCLLMASMIDINVFKKLDGKQVRIDDGAQALDLVDPFYRRLPKWLALNMTAWVLITSFGVMLFLPDHSASVLVMVASLTLVITATSLAAHRQSHPYLAWGAVGILGIFMSSMLVNHVIPAISLTRSIQVSVNEIQSSEGFGDSQVVYFARDSFATSIGLEDSNVVYFSKKEATAAAAYLIAHPHAILVTAEEYLERLEKELHYAVVLDKQESARHVYLASPIRSRNRSVHVAEETGETSNR